ncbi:MAG TPA: DUF3040 domain-containing protein [Mycobacteriales bacterium]|nr:DUF3040 domain-containing protein [Mycobacteriales bacterium]
MPLSDHEQRLLEQIERALYAEDPKFASTVSSTNLRTHARRRLVRAVLGFVLGIVALLAGVAKWQPLAVAGFLVMFAAVVYAVPQSKKMFGRPELRVVGEPAKTRKPRKPSLLKRMEERFRRRFDER